MHICRRAPTTHIVGEVAYLELLGEHAGKVGERGVGGVTELLGHTPYLVRVAHRQVDDLTQLVRATDHLLKVEDSRRCSSLKVIVLWCG